jgi:hypothetical protein
LGKAVYCHGQVGILTRLKCPLRSELLRTDKIQVANMRFSKAGLSFFWNIREHPKTIAAITLDGAIAAIVV